MYTTMHHYTHIEYKHVIVESLCVCMHCGIYASCRSICLNINLFIQTKREQENSLKTSD